MREQESLRRASEERLRIARELHDAFGHHLSLINVQSGVALHLNEDLPEQTRSSLSAIKQASKEALIELRSVLDILREQGERAPRSPTSTLARLDDLVIAGGGRRARGSDRDRGHGATAPLRRRRGGLPDRAGGAHERHPSREGSDRDRAGDVRRSGPHRSRSTTTAGARPWPVRWEPGRGSSACANAWARSAGSSRQARGPEAGSACGHASPGRLERRGHVIRVVLADDQVLVRAGFRALLDAQDDIEVVGEADDGERAVRLAAELTPDVVLMDIRMPGMDGLEATRRIVQDERLDRTRIVILTTFDVDEYVFEALRVGASGFLVKDTEPDVLLQGVRAVARGDALLSPGVTRRLIGGLQPRGDVVVPVRFRSRPDPCHRDVQRHRLVDRARGRGRRPRAGATCSIATTSWFAAQLARPRWTGDQDDGRRLPRSVRRARPRDPLRGGRSVTGCGSAGVDVRIGLHSGEVELRGNDIGGIAVNIGARVAASRLRGRCRGVEHRQGPGRRVGHRVRRSG